jgi:hypothetical protein
VRIFEDEPDTDREPATDFSSDEALEVFARMRVYVEFDSDQRGRRPVEDFVAGHPGQWICAYSSLSRLIDAHRGEEVEYSVISGAMLLAQLPDSAGVWFDRSYPGARKLVLPPVAITTEVP